MWLRKKEKTEVLGGLLWGWQPAELLPCRREAKLSSFPWLASPATACAASRQDARGHEGTAGATARFPQVPSSAVTGSGSEMTFPRCSPVGCCFSLCVLASSPSIPHRGCSKRSRALQQGRKKMLELLSWEVKCPKMALWWLFWSCHCQQKGKKKKK